MHVAVLKMFSEHSVTVTEASQELLTLPREMVRGGSDKTKAAVKTLGKGKVLHADNTLASAEPKSKLSFGRREY